MKILALADLHSGSRLAPWPQGTSLEDGNSWGLSRVQAWLMECWGLMCADAKKRRPDVVLLVGDLVEGIAPDNGELITNNLHEQQGAAVELLSMAIPRKAKVYAIKGTPRHEGLMSGITDGVARELGAIPSEGGTHVRPYLLLDTPGGLLYAVHHTGGGSLPWTKTNSSQRGYWILKMSLSDAFGIDPTRLRATVTAHIHSAGMSIPGEGEVIACLPCWQLKTAYAHKRMPFVWPDIGYMKLEATERGFSGCIKVFKQPELEVDTWNPE